MQRLRATLGWGQRLSLEYQRTRVSLAAGGLAYFVALSVVPAALAFGTLAGLVLDPDQVHDALDRLAQRAPEAGGAAQPILAALLSTVEQASATTFTLTTLVAAIIAIYGSSKVVQGVRMAMNTVFGVVETRSGLVDRALSALITLLAMFLAVGLVVVVVVLPTVLGWFGIDDWVGTRGGPFNWLIAAVLVYLAVRWVLQHAPDHGQRVEWTSPAPFLTTGGILLATAGVGVYARLSTSLGTAIVVFGTAIVVLLWLYLCFIALLWGAVVEADRQRERAATSTANEAGRRPGR